jgi:hypothetical protein
MFDSHGYYGQPGLTAQQFLPQGLLGAAPTAFAQYGAFGTLPGPWGQPTGPSIGGWPGQLPLGAFAPQGLFGGLPGQGQQAQPFGAFGPAHGNPQYTGFGPQGGLFGGLPGQQAQPFGAFGAAQGNPQFTGLGPQSGLFGNLPGQQAQQMGPYAQMGQPPIGYPFGGWPGQMQLACITPQGLIAILPGQFAQPIGLGQPIGTLGAWPGQQQLGSHFGAAAGRSFLPYQVPSQMAYA